MPISTALFLQWPKALTHLSITIRRDGGPLGYAWHSMFLIHKDTLKSVYISNRLPRGSSDDEELFPASAFPNLETLGISQWKTPRDLHFSPADADALLGPKLKTFVWDFRIAKRGLRASSPFGEPEELWLRGLVKAVMTRNASIRRIHIDIGNLEPDSLESPLETGYSWGALDKMCVDFRPFGIICSYGREPF
ncbi:hypothetical protein GQ43DRAFT_438438 [Delitschia confertaspora ATCC 74209]|uniref:Uncharacterized protein n=1 Tax=Delitschia confertaspora ATCC 74209 TaxID=1513339 RepID=A0A9P4JWN7_9PLEO|nr:hypothetical protein GQ43DRAFT_438438 [Delitschia confertaspora ATCC 74209]